MLPHTLPGQEAADRKELHREQRQERRQELKESRERGIIRGSYIFAKLSTTVTFELADGILNARLGLEDLLGLESQSNFFSGSFIYRLTPKSGLGINYYGLSRSVTSVTDQDYIFLKDTIPAGSSTVLKFSTRVFSLGYVYTLIDNPKTFFGAYVNLYFMDVGASIRSEGLKIERQADITAPLPNFGVLGNYRFSPRWEIEGNLGYFGLNLENFGGRLANISAHLVYRPWRWLGLNAGFQQFELQVDFEEGDVKTVVEYTFRGPALGAKVMF